MPKERKAKKEKPSETLSTPSQLGRGRQIAVRSYDKLTFIDIRQWVEMKKKDEDDEDGEKVTVPTGKGVTFSLDEARKLLKVLPKHIKALEKLEA